MPSLHSGQFEHTPEAHGQGTLFDVPKWEDVIMTGRELKLNPPKRVNKAVANRPHMQTARDLYKRAVTEGRPAIQLTEQAMEGMARGEPRYKSQFETGHSRGYLDEINERIGRSSGEDEDTFFRWGSLSRDSYEDEDEAEYSRIVSAHTSSGRPGFRAKYEQNEFGYPTHGMNPRHRPVYGYIQHPDIHSAIGQYGDATAILKPHVRDRATTTFGDSLGSEERGRRPSRLSDIMHGRDPGAAEETLPTYIEAQYHGGIQTRDIDHIEVSDRDWRSVSHAQDMGVHWRMEGHDQMGYQPSLFNNDAYSAYADQEHAAELTKWQSRERARMMVDKAATGASHEEVEATRWVPSTLFHGQRLSRQFTRHASPGFRSEYDIQH